MEKLELASLIERLCNYYERKDPRDETITEWMEKCNRIPPVCINWMIEKIKERYDAFPKNLPLVLRGLWSEWMRANPDKVDRKEFHCRQPACKEGFLFVRKETYSYVFRCAECNAREDHPAIPKSTLHTLELGGYVLDKPRDNGDGPKYDPAKWKKAILPRLGEVLDAARFQ